MIQQRFLTIADQRALTPKLRWLTLDAPDLARGARAGQYLLVRCAEPDADDPLLRRPLFVAAAEPALGQIALLFAPNDRGLAWLARGRPGDVLDVLGPFGRPFALGPRTRTLLCVGAGPGLAALLLLARAAAAQQVAVTLLAGAGAADELPPAYLLPGEVEYQTIAGAATDLLASQPSAAANTPDEQRASEKRRRETPAPAAPASLPPIAWADQVCAALPSGQLPYLANAIRAARLRWEPGFASALLEGPLICGVGACGACPVELRRGIRLLCSDGPVFDLRDLALEAA